MKIKTPAFVLKTTIFKESSLIIRLFTREKGKCTYIVKAAMRQKSPPEAPTSMVFGVTTKAVNEPVITPRM